MESVNCLWLHRAASTISWSFHIPFEGSCSSLYYERSNSAYLTVLLGKLMVWHYDHHLVSYLRKSLSDNLKDKEIVELGFCSQWVDHIFAVSTTTTETVDFILSPMLISFPYNYFWTLSTMPVWRRLGKTTFKWFSSLFRCDFQPDNFILQLIPYTWAYINWSYWWVRLQGICHCSLVLLRIFLRVRPHQMNWTDSCLAVAPSLGNSDHTYQTR